MNEKHRQDLRRYYGIFFLVVTVALGLLFILQATDIYFGGGDPIYSRALVSQRLKLLIPYICIWLATLIGSIIIAIKCPLISAPRRDPDIMLEQKLKSNCKRLPSQAKKGCEEDFSAALATWHKLHRQSQYLKIALGALCVVFFLPPFLYFADSSHFPSESSTVLNSGVLNAVLYALPFLLVVLGGSIAYIYLHHRLMKKEMVAIKAVITIGERTAKPVVTKKFPILSTVRICLFAIGAGLLVLGTQNGSMQEVLTKAINICTECIGLG